MKTYRLERVLLLIAFVLAALHLRADEEQDLIATIQSDARPAEKCTACLRLRIIGTTNSVAPLASLLTDEATAHAARNALEGLPLPEAVAAMREALGRTEGLLKVGLIDSLGRRQDKDSVPLLIPLLSDHNTAITSAAASALGKIGNDQAVEALLAMRDKAPPTIRSAVCNSLLRCGEAMLAKGDAQRATALYRGLLSSEFPESIRVAAWRGLVLAEPAKRPQMVTQALTGADRLLRDAALKIVRELDDPAVLSACARQWAALPAAAQLAVLDAQIKRGADVLPLVRIALQSPHPAVRIAAWQALGDVGDSSSIDALVRTASQGETAERDAARDSLARLHGGGIREAMLDHLERAAPPEKAVLLRALGDRDDAAAADVLLKNATATGAVRLAALDSLRKVALPDTAIPLLQLLPETDSEADRQPILSVLLAICQAAPDKDQLTRKWIDVINRFPPPKRPWALPLWAELGTPTALGAVLAIARDSDADLSKAGITVLGQWPDATAAPGLLELAQSESDSTLQILALRGYITLAGQEPDLNRRLAMLQQVWPVATRPEERKQALGQLGQIPTPEALKMAVAHLTDPAMTNEAAVAALAIAEKLAPKNPDLAGEVGAKVLAQNKNPVVVQRAQALMPPAARSTKPQ